MILRTKKNRLFFILLMATLIFITTLTTIYFTMNKQISEFLTQKSTEFISKLIKAEITAEKIEGNILKGIVLSKVKIIFPTGDSLYVEQVEIDYDFLSIIRQRGNKVRRLKIVRPIICITSKLKTSTNNINLNLALPLLLINHLEIHNGCLISDNQSVLDSFSILANLNLRPNRANLLIKRLSFFMPGLANRIQNIQGRIALQNNIVNLSNFTMRSALASLDFDAQVNLNIQSIDLTIKNADVDLTAFNNNNSGQMRFSGAASVGFLPTKWTITNITSDINYQTKNLSIQNNPIPDGKGKFHCQENNLTVNYQALANDSMGRSESSLLADIYFNPLSYKGQLTFINIPIRIKGNQFNYLHGNANFNGIKTDSIDIKIVASSSSPQIESITAQAKLRKGQIILENLRIKDKSNILDVNGQGRLMTGRKEFNLTLLFSNFSLSLLADVLNNFSHTEIDLNGIANGSAAFTSYGNIIASSANINIKNGAYDKLQFNQLNLKYQLEDITKLNGEIALSGDNISWPGNNLTRLEYIQEQDKFSLQIDNLKNNSLIAHGKLMTEAKNINCFCDSLQIINNTDIIRTTQPFSLGFTDEHLYIKNFSLVIGAGVLSCDISKKPTSPLVVSLVANQLDLSIISSILNLKHPLKGALNLNLTTSNNPLLYNVSFSVNDAIFPITTYSDNLINHQSPVNLKLINGSFGISDTSVSIDEIAIVYQTDTSKIKGKVLLNHLPVNQLPLDLNIAFADPGPWIFFFLKNVVDLREGKIYGQGKIQGTLQEPVLSGEISITDGNLYIVPTRTLCDSISAQLTFAGRQINITDINGKVGPGSINAQGFVKLLAFTKVDTISIQTTFRDAPFRPEKDIFVIATGNLNIDHRPDNKIRPKIPLALAGDIQIKEALITTEFEASPSATTSEPDNIDFNLKISSARDIWLRNRMCDVELSANLNIFRQEKNVVYSGELNALQGKLYYLDHTLTITKGMLIFDNESEFNPELDISAELQTRKIQVLPGQFERMKIVLALTGRLKEPVFVFSSDPPYLTENDIISYLTLNVTWQEISAFESRELLTNAIGGKLLGYFERELAKQIRNLVFLDYLWIESGLLSGNGAKVTVGKYISPKLYFTYEYDITGNIYDIFRLEYYITKSHEVIGEHDQDGRYKLKYQYKIRY